MMTVPVNVAMLFAAGGTLIITSGFILYAMIGKVNQKLPEDQQISYIFFHPAKALRITREFRRFYPNSHLNIVRIVLNVIGFIFMVACAVELSNLGGNK